MTRKVKRATLILFTVFLALSAGTWNTEAKGASHAMSSGSSHARHSSGASTAPKVHATKPLPPPPSPPTSTTSVPRDSHGRIARNESTKRTFERQTGYPNGRPGYVVDHIKPLACGGADAPSNMQWQTISEAKAKDKTERIGCR